MPRLALAALALAAWLTLGAQLVLSIQSALADGDSAWSGIVAYLGYFTILTNILCAKVLTAHAIRADLPGLAFLRRPGVATMAASSIIVVGVVYHTLLAAQWNPEGLQLVVDHMLHTVLPVGFVIVWTRLVPRGAVTFAQSPWWASYLVAYAAYILVRGRILGEYPYFFIDVGTLGYPVALRNAALLGVAFVALSAGMVGFNRLVGAPRTPET